jgi:site-specific DNA-methyltransferase (adenine-specific)/modification methylase
MSKSPTKNGKTVGRSDGKTVTHPAREVCRLSDRCTIILGDCRKLAPDLHFDAIISDPPYGIAFQHSGGGHGFLLAKRHYDPIIGDDKPFDPSWMLSLCGTTKPFCFMGADKMLSHLPPGGTLLCWDKACATGPANTFCDAEYAWTNRKTPRQIFHHLWKGTTRSHTGEERHSIRLHVSQKPVALMAWLISSARVGLGKTILDPYMGSGTTGIAALQGGHNFIGIEIDPAHFATARDRLAAYIASCAASAASEASSTEAPHV